ncbi:DUF3713 domain-containing protein [Mycoplasmoides pneumoniae]|uniref:DUF3713 domain-containing protein n=1 Tax=Mycoplasmoides pneumoniae TaxID=2104 RepID=UPI0027DEBFE1|nr:DUF3713 domain-containing protein [Mycoplasmoides pneumoniae]
MSNKTCWIAPGGLETWKAQKLFEQLINDFASRVFQKNYLAYKDGNKVSSGPFLFDEISKSSNWDKIVFDAGQFPEINDAFFAQIQSEVFDQWAEYTDPTVISFTTLKYSAPNQGLGQIYNQDKLKDKLTPSYAFPFFAAADEIAGSQNVGNKRWKQLVKGEEAIEEKPKQQQDGSQTKGVQKEGLTKYVRGTDRGQVIDFPLSLSDTNETKKVVDATNIVDQLEAADLAAVLNIKLDRLGQEKDELLEFKELKDDLNNVIVIDKSSDAQNVSKTNSSFYEDNQNSGTTNTDPIAQALDNIFATKVEQKTNLGKLAEQIKKAAEIKTQTPQARGTVVLRNKSQTQQKNSYVLLDAGIPTFKQQVSTQGQGSVSLHNGTLISLNTSTVA